MDNTTYELSEDMDGVSINFDLTNDEDCFIQLFFTRDDIGNLMNMDVFGKYKMEIEGISGTCTRDRGPLEQQKICFNYSNSDSQIGTVYYSYEKLKKIMTNCFSALHKLQTENED